MRNIKSIILIFLTIFIFTACSKNEVNTPIIDKTNVERVKTPIAPTFDNKFIKALGIAKKRKDNNIYMQRVLAQANARAELSNILNSEISSIWIKEVKVRNNIKKEKFSQDIKIISNSLLENSTQTDIYFDEKETMFLTLKITKDSIENEVKNYNKKNKKVDAVTSQKRYDNFDKEALLNSKCYDKNTLSTIITKSKIYKGYPSWFYNPNMNNNIGGVGIAKYIKKRKFYFQKRLAYQLALNDISKNIKTKVNSKSRLKKELKDEVYKTSFQSDSIQKSSNLMKRVFIKDIFLDNKSCDLFMWVVRK